MHTEADASCVDDDDALTRAAEADPDSPPLSDEELAGLLPASDMLPRIFGARVAARMLAPGPPVPRFVLRSRRS